METTFTVFNVLKERQGKVCVIDWSPDTDTTWCNRHVGGGGGGDQEQQAEEGSTGGASVRSSMKVFPTVSFQLETRPYLEWLLLPPLLLLLPVVEASSCRLDFLHLGYCRVEAAEPLVSDSPVPLGILDTMYLEPFGTGCLTTSFPFLVSARNRLYQ